MSSPSLVFPNIDAAIAQFEGFNTPGTPAQRNNNPGNLVAGNFASTYGGTGTPGTFATFPNVAAGLAAEDGLVKTYSDQGATIQDLINAWAPPNAPGNTPQSTQNYINFVASAAGAQPTTPVSSLASAPGSSSVIPTFPGLPPGIIAPGSTPTNPGSTGVIGGSNPFYCSIPFVAEFATTSCPGAQIFNQGTGVAGQAAPKSAAPGFSWGRIGAFLLGLVLIVGAVFLFKPATQIVQQGRRAFA